MRRYANLFMYLISSRTIRMCRRQKCRAIIVTIEISECCKHLGSSGRKIIATTSFGRFCKHGIYVSPNFFILIFNSFCLCCLPSDDLGGATAFYPCQTRITEGCTRIAGCLCSHDSECVFEALCKDVSTRFGRRIVEKCFENTLGKNQR